jgi:hypothetical protein
LRPASHLFREERRQICKDLEFKRIAGRIKQEDRRLLADLPLESDRQTMMSAQIMSVSRAEHPSFLERKFRERATIAAFS